jgi:polyisoprenoid-binding protein YceI
VTNSDNSATTTAVPLTGITPGPWVLDPSGSEVRFQHKSVWGMVNVKGHFTDISGSGEVAPDGTASGRVVIAAASLDSGHTQRDKHLRSADFFDVIAFPELVVDARSVTASAPDTATVDGTLTVKDVTRPLTFTAHATEVTANAVTLTAEVTVDRADYQMNWNKAGMLKGLATINLTVRFRAGSDV